MQLPVIRQLKHLDQLGIAQRAQATRRVHRLGRRGSIA